MERNCNPLGLASCTKSERKTLRDRKIVAVWPMLLESVSRLCATELIEQSTCGLSGNPETDIRVDWCDLFDDGSITIGAVIQGYVRVPLRSIIAPELDIKEVEAMARETLSCKPQPVEPSVSTEPQKAGD